MRWVDGLCLALAVAGAAYVYDVKHEAETAHDSRRTLERDIAAISADVDLLEADLAALEQPVRLQALVEGSPEAFSLEPIASDHYVRLSDLPFRADLIAEVTGSIGDESADADAQPANVTDAAPNQLDALVRRVLAETPDTASNPLDALLADLLASPDAALPAPPLPPALVPSQEPAAVEAAPSSGDPIANLLGPER
ncbi:MAG: hypothetical protein KI785_00225 [Devosiaceae bacterium]|nr:hypothetical protein [Devosiaceae bacterium MH13]